MPSLDSAYYSTASLTPELISADDSLLFLWTEYASFPVTWGESSFGTNWLGLSFSFTYSQDAEGHPLAPSLPFTRPADSISGMAALPYTLTLGTGITSLAGLSSDRWTLYGLYQNTQTIFSSTNPISSLPASQQLTLVSSQLITEYLTLNGSTYDLAFSWQFPDDFTLGSGGTVDGPFSKMTNHPAWNRRLQFWAFHDVASHITVTSATLSGPQYRFHSGAWDPPGRTRTRAVHDYKTGEPYWSHEAVRDGYRENTRLHPWNWDPQDPGVTGVPNPNERRVEDEIDSLE